MKSFECFYKRKEKFKQEQELFEEITSKKNTTTLTKNQSKSFELNTDIRHLCIF